MSYQAGDTYPATLTVRDENQALADPATLTLKVLADAVLTTYVSPHATIVHDSTGHYHADIGPLTAGVLVIEWSTTSPAQTEGIQVFVAPAPTDTFTLATLDELALRLGRTPEPDGSMLLLQLATGLIVDAVGRDDEWLQALTPIPAILRAVCLEMVARVLTNPSSARSESETLGQYMHSVSFIDGAHGLWLTDAEAQLCRRTVLRFTSGSAKVDSIVDELACIVPIFYLPEKYDE